MVNGELIIRHSPTYAELVKVFTIFFLSLMKNYYLVLGVSPDATLEQIRGAYREQAKELHPDHYGPDSKPFIDLQEAYAVLSDPAQRRAYDHKKRQPIKPRRRGGRVVSEPLVSRWVQPEPGIFQSKIQQVQQPLIQVLVRLKPREAKSGGRLRLIIPLQMRCPSCRGWGGSLFFPCRTCGGQGRLINEIPLNLSYPAGTVNNQTADLPLNQSGINNPNLRIIFRVEP